MKKTFIPKEFRPSVPGSSLKSLNGSAFEFPRNSENRPEKYVILSSQGDLVAKKVWESLKSDKTAIHFYLDELGYTWDFSYSNERLTLLTPSGKITPLSIYHRHPGVAQDHPFYSKHISLFEVMDIPFMNENFTCC